MSKPFLIGITGGSGSGKTTLLQAIREQFSPAQVCIISQDDYYVPIEKQYVDEQGIENFDLPRSINKKAFRKDIEKLIAGQDVTIQEYTFNNKTKKPQFITFRAAPIIVVEGLFVFHYKKILNLLDLKVYLHAKENLKVIRRIKRDRVERNYPLDDVLYRYENHVLPSFEKYIAPYRESADIVINNNEAMKMGTQVMVGFIKEKLLNGEALNGELRIEN